MFGSKIVKCAINTVDYNTKLPLITRDAAKDGGEDMGHGSNLLVIGTYRYIYILHIDVLIWDIFERNYWLQSRNFFCVYIMASHN